MRRIACLLCLFCSLSAVAGCTQFPELDHTQTEALDRAAYPALVPIDPILAELSGPSPDPSAEEARLQARLSGLRARAARLRGSVLDGAARQRLERGLE